LYRPARMYCYRRVGSARTRCEITRAAFNVLGGVFSGGGHQPRSRGRVHNVRRVLNRAVGRYAACVKSRRRRVSPAARKGRSSPVNRIPAHRLQTQRATPLWRRRQRVREIANARLYAARRVRSPVAAWCRKRQRSRRQSTAARQEPRALCVMVARRRQLKR